MARLDRICADHAFHGFVIWRDMLACVERVGGVSGA